jgi:hypothetical protein
VIALVLRHQAFEIGLQFIRFFGAVEQVGRAIFAGQGNVVLLADFARVHPAAGQVAGEVDEGAGQQHFHLGKRAGMSVALQVADGVNPVLELAQAVVLDVLEEVQQHLALALRAIVPHPDRLEGTVGIVGEHLDKALIIVERADIALAVHDDLFDLLADRLVAGAMQQRPGRHRMRVSARNEGGQEVAHAHVGLLQRSDPPGLGRHDSQARCDLERARKRREGHDPARLSVGGGCGQPLSYSAAWAFG